MKKRKYPGRKPGSTTVTDEQREAIVADYKAGMLLPDLVEKHKRSKSTIWNVARKAGISFRRAAAKLALPEGTGSAGKKKNKFVQSGEAADIVADYAAGMLQKDLISKYKRSHDAIRRAVKLAGVPLRGRGYSGTHVATMKARKGTMRAKMKKRMSAKKHVVVAASINHANRALHKAQKQNGAVSRAVAALLKALAHEDIQDIFVDFGKREFKLTRFRTEEGRVQ